MPHAWSRFVLLILLPAAAAAEPRISPGGVLHGAALAPQGLPGSSIARGSLVTILGAELGPAAGVRAHGYSNEPELAGVRVTVTDSTGAQRFAYPTFVQSGQVHALMPCSMALGTTRLAVTVNGRSSPLSEPFQTVQQNFQLFTRNHKGWGAAAAENVVEDGSSFNSMAAPAAPGQLVALWGTGLGSCGLEPSPNHAPEHGSLPEGDVRIQIGDKPAPVVAYRRPAAFPGVEQVLAVIPPDAPQGCYVPVVVRSGHAAGNFASISIARSGDGCRDTLNGFPLLIEKLKERPITWARIQLFRGAALTERPGILTLQTSSEMGEAGFLRSSMESLEDGFHYPVPGACLVMPSGIGNGISTRAGLALDAGDLILRGPWDLAFFHDPADGLYRRRLSPTPFEGRSGDFIRPNSQYRVAGHGSPQVGHFAAEVTVPGFLEWTNRDHLPFRLRRSDPLVLTWRGGDPSREFVAIRGSSLDRQSRLARDFICAERVEAGSFTLPDSVMMSLPPSELDLLLSVGNVPQLPAPHFGAAGIDMGFFTYEIASGRNFALE